MYFDQNPDFFMASIARARSLNGFQALQHISEPSFLGDDEAVQEPGNHVIVFIVSHRTSANENFGLGKRHGSRALKL